MVTAWQQDRRRKQAQALKSEAAAGLEAILGGLSDEERRRIAEEERKRKAEAADAEMGLKTSAMEARTAAEKARAESNVLREKRLEKESVDKGFEREARTDVLRKKAGAEEADRARAEADRKRADTVTSMSRRMDALTSRADVEKAAAEAGMAPDEFLAAVAEQQEKALGEQEKTESRLDLEEARAEQARAAADKAKRPPVLKAKKAPPTPEQKAQTTAKDSMPLRKEFASRPEIKAAVSKRADYRLMEGASKDPSAAGDLAMVFSFMKVLDPGSVVKETEFANAQNAAGVPERIRNEWNRLKAGERLSPAQRIDFLNQAKRIADVAEQDAAKVREQYRGIATRSGLNPIDVVGEDETPAAASAAPASAAAPKPAPGGKVRVTNGQETLEIDAADLPAALADGFKVVRRG